jgi:hypothetical protein
MGAIRRHKSTGRNAPGAGIVVRSLLQELDMLAEAEAQSWLGAETT